MKKTRNRKAARLSNLVVRGGVWYVQRGRYGTDGYIVRTTGVRVADDPDGTKFAVAIRDKMFGEIDRKKMEKATGKIQMRSMTVDQGFAIYFDEFTAVQCVEDTQDSNLSKHRALRRILGDATLIENIDFAKVMDYRKTRLAEGVCGSTVNGEIAELRLMLDHVCDDQHRVTPPQVNLHDRKVAKKLRLKVQKSAKRYLTVAQAVQLISAATIHPLIDILQFLVLTGIRYSNVMELTWEQISGNQVHLVVKDRTSKGGRPVTLTLNKYAVQLLDRLGRRATGPVWRRGTGKAALDCTAGFNGCAERVGLGEFTPHNMRHTFASWHALSGKVNLFQLQQMMTHLDAKSTQHYIHLNQDGGQHIDIDAAFQAVLDCQRAKRPGNNKKGKPQNLVTWNQPGKGKQGHDRIRRRAA